MTGAGVTRLPGETAYATAAVGLELSVPIELMTMVSRRHFLEVLGGTTAGVFLVPPTMLAEHTLTGSVEGGVADVHDASLARGGLLTLLDVHGRQVDGPRPADAEGRFRFTGVRAGRYQLHYDGVGQAAMPITRPHPIALQVTAGRVSRATVEVGAGTFQHDHVDILCGDGFFRAHPAGSDNEEVLVRLGAVVSWLNAGSTVHTVTGGPWRNSGPLRRRETFIWVANQTGVFSYRCRHGGSRMRASLRVVV